MQSKIIIFFALVAIAAAGSNNSKEQPDNSNGAKNKRGLIEFGYGYGFDSTPDFEYIYPPYSPEVTAGLQSIITKEVSLPLVHQSLTLPVKKYVQVPPYTKTVDHVYSAEVPKTPIVIKLAQPYSVSYLKHVPSQVSTYIAAPSASSPNVYEKYSNLNKHSTW
ncbi:uncharacterized protein [Chelonus insularis]|uniref:uncharacterized protein n=1 Tax=Chelonus insularis TaxID=460826 RepID=UPI00158AFC94|nr:uncharacterized protein LOC118069119 [Chelonus insularis]